MEKKGFKMPSAFSILFIIIAILAVITHLIPSVKSASMAQFIMAAPKGFVNAIDVCVFVLCIGGFLGVVADTGALDAGIAAVVKKMNGNELMLIPVLMLIFSLGGTSYGMCEETMAFYVLIVGTMMVAGFDAMVGCATILLGAGVGCLGSTVNPFAVGAAADALKGVGVKVNQSVVIGLGAVLWISSLLIAIFFVMRYAKKVKNEGRTILSAAEKAASEAEYLSGKSGDAVELTGSQKVTLILFGLSFVIMIL
ncbi:MAG: YfcC family protein, partial [Lachnospiraceae bacterium]|nr:YfcC family protein [Lachnospiraceae bacterium]